MPSNTMKISQLVRFLQDQQAAHGDVDCVLQVSELGAAVALDGSNINMLVELPQGKLPAPALVFGIAVLAGVQRNEPGQAYQVTASGETDWNRDRDAAPADKTPLRVWKRFATNGLNEDRGYREGDAWFVYEQSEKPIQIVPAGILGWRVDDRA